MLFPMFPPGAKMKNCPSEEIAEKFVFSSLTLSFFFLSTFNFFVFFAAYICGWWDEHDLKRLEIFYGTEVYFEKKILD